MNMETLIWKLPNLVEATSRDPASESIADIERVFPLGP